MLKDNDIRRILNMGESLEKEFKSDRNRISDQTIYEEIMAMANSQGGILLIGVEDDGTISGSQPRHGQSTDSLKIQSAIFNNTVPHINTRVSVVTFVEGSEGRLHLFFLPSYSPELNPDEQVWNHLKNHRQSRSTIKGPEDLKNKAMS